MKANSSVFRRPLAKSVHLQPKKTHNGSSKLLACSIHEFQFNLPNCSIPITLRNIYSSPSPLPSEYPDGRPCEPLEDCRK